MKTLGSGAAAGKGGERECPLYGKATVNKIIEKEKMPDNLLRIYLKIQGVSPKIPISFSLEETPRERKLFLVP